MNVSGRPIDLYVALAFIGKINGLTPHSSTGHCPFKLIKRGGTPSLFPHLTSQSQRQSELTTVKHCANRLRKRKHFDEGDEVLVYDSHNKLSYNAIVVEVLGSNKFLVQCDNGQKHVSGDVMSKVSDTARRAVGK